MKEILRRQNQCTQLEKKVIPDPIGLYIHIPFCETKCPYCDFNTYSKLEILIPSYVSALIKEIDVWGGYLGKRLVDSIFFGGGTPSYLPRGDINRILLAVRKSFNVAHNAEVTLEANPGDLNDDNLSVLLDAGINRLSIGFQSLEDSLLTVLGRRHSADQAIEAFNKARNAGYDNISVDLMYGISDQSMDDWRNTLQKLLSVAIPPEHVSLYCLTLEGGTPMEVQVNNGSMTRPDDDLAADMYLLAENMLRDAGYDHYEISNWSMIGKESRHNMKYWLNTPYLGVGPGAHSYLNSTRFSNIKSPREYVKLLRSQEFLEMPDKQIHDVSDYMSVVYDSESIDNKLEMAETMMLGLRLMKGIKDQDFVDRFAVSFFDVYQDEVRDLETMGLLEYSSGYIRLTERGRLLANEVFLRFF